MGTTSSAQAVEPPLPSKRQFGRYRLLYRFAAGGMAQLYLGQLSGADGFEKLVALKVIHPHLTEQDEFVKMFIDEARLASRISHPNVVHIIELGKVESQHFIAMEYVDGESLATVLRHTHPPARIGARIVADAAAGLHAAHELKDQEGKRLGVIHRDVSPQNILVSYGGATKVVDFGVARARGSLHTTRGELKGKLGYMAPEQLMEERKIDRRTDVFALGIVMFELTTRRRLFKADSEERQIVKVLQGEITPPSRIVEGYPEELEHIVLRALDRDPDRRFQTARELQVALERFIASSGDPVLQDDVGEMMAELFSGRMFEKKQLFERAVSQVIEDSSVPEVELVSNASMALGSVGSLLPAKRRGGLVLGLVGVLLLAVLVVVGVLLFSGGDGSKPATAADATVIVVAPPDAAAPAVKPEDKDETKEAKQISISVRARPRSAVILLDGKQVPNPLKMSRPAAEGVAKLEVKARGHLPQTFEVPLDRGGTWVVSLDRRRHVHRHQPTKGKGTKKKPKGSLGDEDVVVNPYK